MTELLRMLDLSYWGCAAEESTAVSADISPSELTEYLQLCKWLQAWWKSWWLTSLSTLPSEILSLKQKLAASTLQGCHPFDQPMVNWWFGVGFKLEEGLFAYCTITIGTRNPNHQPKPSLSIAPASLQLRQELTCPTVARARRNGSRLRSVRRNGPERLVVLVTQLWPITGKGDTFWLPGLILRSSNLYEYYIILL